MREFSKSQKRQLRDLSALVFERELKRSLAALSGHFGDWRAGKVTSLELAQHIHEYDYGESRRIGGKFQSKQYEMLVAQGFVEGLLTENEIGPDLFKELQPAIEFYRDDR